MFYFDLIYFESHTNIFILKIVIYSACKILNTLLQWFQQKNHFHISRLQAKPGQKISITLMDFSTIPSNDDVCHAYAILRENHPQRSNTICSGKSREAQAYTSVSNVLEVRIIGGSTEQTKGTRYFILKYKGRRNQYYTNKRAFVTDVVV